MTQYGRHPSAASNASSSINGPRPGLMTTGILRACAPTSVAFNRCSASDGVSPAVQQHQDVRPRFKRPLSSPSCPVQAGHARHFLGPTGSSPPRQIPNRSARSAQASRQAPPAPGSSPAAILGQGRHLSGFQPFADPDRYNGPGRCLGGSRSTWPVTHSTMPRVSPVIDHPRQRHASALALPTMSLDPGPEAQHRLGSGCRA